MPTPLPDLDQLAAAVRDRIPMITISERRVPIRPFVIEFSGTPKAGKSYISGRLETVLGNNGFRVAYLPEAAAINPLSRKEDATWNVWNAVVTLARLLEETDRNRAHVVILDRGLFDCLVWMEWRSVTGRLEGESYDRVARFLLMKQWRDLVDIVFVLTVDAEVARSRDTLGLTDQAGRVMNQPTLSQLNQVARQVCERYGSLFRYVHQIDTSDLDPQTGARTVVSMMLDTFSKVIQEKIITINRASCGNLLTENTVVPAGECGDLLDAIRRSATPHSKQEAEADAGLFKIVCGAVVMFGDRLLFLRRREQNPSHPLHDRYTVWAGGHARDTDLASGSLFESCLERELDEELYIRSEYSSEIIGYVYTPAPESAPGQKRVGSSADHLLILFRVVLETEDVSVSMTNREFKDRRGMSLSCQFLRPPEVMQYWQDLEPWSRTILATYFNVPRPADQIGERPLPLDG